MSEKKTKETKQNQTNKQTSKQLTNQKQGQNKPYKSTRWSTQLHICSDNFIAY